jgi:hypothetical protein
MRCSRCGFPLSPTRKECPRCGTPVADRSNGRAGNEARVSPPLQQNGFAPTGAPVGLEVAQQQWDANAAYIPNTPQDAQAGAFTQQGAPSAYPSANNAIYEQVPFPSANTPFPPSSDAAFSAPTEGPISPFPDAALPSSGPGQSNQAWVQQAPMMPMNAAQDWGQAQQTPFNSAPTMQAGMFQQTPRQFSRLNIQGWSTRTGFTAASVCVVLAALILLFVHIMAQSLPASNPSGQTAAQTQPTPVATLAPAPTPSPSPAVSPTPTYPAQQYVDNVQMASAVNTATAQPVTMTTTFKVRQTIYVTMALHPANHIGAICLLWFLNNQQFSRYAFSVGGTTQQGYSYTRSTGPGSGYVQIYWASTTACTDEQLAQQANFTVTD